MNDMRLRITESHFSGSFSIWRCDGLKYLNLYGNKLEELSAQVVSNS